MIEFLGMHRPHDGQVICDGCQVGQEFGYLCPGLAVLREAERGTRQVGSALNEGELVATNQFGRDGRAMQRVQAGFVVE